MGCVPMKPPPSPETRRKMADEHMRHAVNILAAGGMTMNEVSRAFGARWICVYCGARNSKSRCANCGAEESR
jgi:hypothetical protein